MTISYLYVGVLEQGDYAKKGVSKGWCKESNYIQGQEKNTCVPDDPQTHRGLNLLFLSDFSPRVA